MTLTMATTLLSLLLVGYIIYMRFLHPLSKYPGPLLASLSNTWKAYYVYKLILHERLVSLHERYGPIVRIGPNHLHTWDGEAISPIYKGGRQMGKTEFYDAFTAFNPNLFGGTNEDIHSLRRRQLSHGFSQSSIQTFEPLIDINIKILIQKLQYFTKTGEIFDLKMTISHFVLDILGQVAFSQSFDSQSLDKYITHIPAINDHLLLSCVIGELPLQSVTKLLVRWSPIGWMRRLVKSRNVLKAICASCVRKKIENPEGQRDLLKSLVTARDPETGDGLSEQEINSEAFAMLVAGSHSTSGTLTLLLWHLVQNPDILAKVQAEILSLKDLKKEGDIYSIAGLEASLPYLMACVRENFRLNPVFTMPLWRRVNSPAGASISEYELPYGTNICISNYVLHHNPEIWGSDHMHFKPERWLNDSSASKSRFLIPFSIGHRMCIGRNLAMTNILKAVTTLVTMFDIEPVEARKEVRVRSSGIGEMEGTFLCRVKGRGGAGLS